VGREIVDRLLDGQPITEITKVTDKKIRLQRIRMIEIDILGRTSAVRADVFVVRIVLDHKYTASVKMLQNRVGDGRFA
jgi:hypothetical protein